VILESLPRSESSLLSVKLGGLFLRDLTTQGTIFPVLVSPKTVSSEVGGVGGGGMWSENMFVLFHTVVVVVVFLVFSLLSPGVGQSGRRHEPSDIWTGQLLW